MLFVIGTQSIETFEFKIYVESLFASYNPAYGISEIVSEHRIYDNA